tara:strand:+ start:367 stop:1263 length:897 start_codon:yes stop_codon:yes gene_type:complete
MIGRKRDMTQAKIQYLLLMAFMLIYGGASYAEPNAEPKTKDEKLISYTLKMKTDPIVNRIHVLKVDLTSQAVKAAVVLGPDPDGEGPADVALTDPRVLAAGKSVLAFVNTNPWDSIPDAQGKKNRSWYPGQPVVIHGLAATGGKVRAGKAPTASSVWFDAKTRVHFGHKKEDSPQEGTAGFQLILSKNKVLVPEGGARHPRTAIGSDEEGKALILVVVDGRQPGFSEGMNLYELAQLMKELGCWQATNMDGGGSSVMGMVNSEGEMKIMNSPSDRFLGFTRVRPLPMVLTFIKAEPAK